MSQVVIGVPLYNGEQHLSEALESLLTQSYREVRVVLVDDGSTDATYAIARRYVQLDHRVHYERNPQRLGMTGNWRRAFWRARELHPASRYFAWGSDHDVWHPEWLATLVEILDRRAEVAVAYGLNLGIADDGTVIREPWRFDTDGINSKRLRVATAVNGMVAGNMIYGLLRADLVERCGVYPSVLLPDRLVLGQMAWLGEFVQVPQILWHRRYRVGVKASHERQRQSFWPDGPPGWASLPWPVQHAGWLAVHVLVRRRLETVDRRRAGIEYFSQYVVHSVLFRARRHLQRRLARAEKRRLRRERALVKRLESAPGLKAASEPAKFALRGRRHGVHRLRVVRAKFVVQGARRARPLRGFADPASLEAARVLLGQPGPLIPKHLRPTDARWTRGRLRPTRPRR